MGSNPSVTGPLYRVGGFCSRHHWPTLVVWILAVIALAVGGWLERLLPRISVEGDDYLAERDAARPSERGVPAEA
jgi:hypothetical protein